jgi:predicted nuclease of predicted toxin-antitoxin system
MPWQTITISHEEAGAFIKSFPKASRFLIDENLGPELAPALRRLGYNATDVFALKLTSRTDEDVIAAAWREHRILLTQDRDFLDDRRFPPNRNPGIVVLPANNNDVLMSALMSALSLIVLGRGLRDGMKVLVGENGRLTVTSYHHTTGVAERTHYKLRMAGPPLIWHPTGSTKSTLPC